MPTAAQISTVYQEIQQRIIDGLEAFEPSQKFKADTWEREGGGGGKSCVLTDGAVFEKAGVNFSHVYGTLPSIIQKEFGVKNGDFIATGVSLVLHPNNPHVPIVHMNIRYFEIPKENRYWFGGGIDLTPIYANKPQVKDFHKVLKSCCSKHHPDYYSTFKKWADDYFFIEHRNETRGVGGVFFDRLQEGDKYGLSKQEIFDFVQELGNSFLASYTPIVAANKDLPFTEHQNKWQLIRRGRYVEFNLVYDRGTHFGLKTNGRVESILMSLPKFASWEYNHQVETGSAEALTQACLVKGIDWV